jgi:hypothetical protein
LTMIIAGKAFGDNTFYKSCRAHKTNDNHYRRKETLPMSIPPGRLYLQDTQ